MNIIEPQMNIWTPAKYGLVAIKKHIERCARVCYNSSDRTTDTSYEQFYRNIVKSGHGSVLEHGTAYLMIPTGNMTGRITSRLVAELHGSPYTVIRQRGTVLYITTSWRVVAEQLSPDLYGTIVRYMADEPQAEHERRITVHWTLSRAIADEFARHRALSHSMQSTRYVKLTKPEVVRPSWLDDSTADGLYRSGLFVSACAGSFKAYRQMIEVGMKPQQARDVLPLATRTELIQTGTLSQWLAFLRLRSAKAGAKGMHPDAAYLADMLHDALAEDFCVH